LHQVGFHYTKLTTLFKEFSSPQIKKIWPQDAVYHLVSAVYCNLTTFA